MNTGLRVILGYKLLQNYGGIVPGDIRNLDDAAGCICNNNDISGIILVSGKYRCTVI